MARVYQSIEGGRIETSERAYQTIGGGVVETQAPTGAAALTLTGLSAGLRYQINMPDEA